eukprot:m.242129 g.242129  ORF g.242129 m.242129 type:complete len:290 (+) comp30078_c0_seq1:53-922(+)
MSVISVVQQLRGLAENKANRRTIVQNDGCLPGLVLFLNNDDKEVVKTAVEALYFLSLCENNHTDMKEELGLIVFLKDLFKNDSVDESVRKMAEDIVVAITTPKKVVGQKVFSMKNVRPALSVIQPSQPRTAASSIFHSSSNYLTSAKTYTLAVEGLDDQHCRRVLEEAFVSLNGVVSFTFNMSRARVDVRTRDWVDVQTLIKAVSDTKLMVAHQVVKDNLGTEVVLGHSSPTKANRPAPKYLDEEDEDDELESVGVDEESKNTLTVHDKSKNTTWFNSLGDYFSKALYW